MSKMVLLLEDRDGNTSAVICNSREAADEIREASRLECVGMAPVISRVDATS